MKFTERDPKAKQVLAAQYRPGEPLEDLAEVARKAYFRPRLAEVPELRVLIVQTRIHDGEELDYDVVEDGGWLLYTLDTHLMYSVTDDEFRGWYLEADE